jgi:DNA polymerase-3 subunit alpha
MHAPEILAINKLLYYWRPSIKDYVKYEPEIRKAIRKVGNPLRNAFANTAILERKICGLGVHACGFVVADETVSKWAPILTCSIEDSKGNEQIVNCTQYEGGYVESSGLIKFDFLGLETLSQMRDICASVKVHYDKDFDIEKIPIDDEKTMELFQTGQTDDVFQFNFKGVQKYLQKFHPTCFEDLIILNRMYHPWPMDYIATFIRQKHSKKAVKYIILCMEKFLHNTYGIIVYQEQIMMLSRLIANFDRGESDLLRKALRERELDVLSVLKPRFIEGGIKNGHKKNALEKVWNEMEAIGRYAIQKSHAVCYTWLAYQMAYLKANYPKEFKHVMEKYNTD